ncbi:tRNA-specific adenosine deaminase 1 [Leucoagaricus sp. SymC.cos]|nr:tRNA-specific adenosine deaminase 1 [Leucoagaricus sp. SymC.cos]
MAFTDQAYDHDEVVEAVHGVYASFGFNPPPDQFTVLASFYLTRPAENSGVKSNEPRFKIISLSTGTKCTPAIKYSPRGELLHDTHAEVLARRGAVRWFIEEVGRMNSSFGYTSDWLAPTSGSNVSKDSDENPPYRLKSNVSVHMYISTLPCGDASMGYLASTQDARMALLKSQSVHLFPKLQAHEASRGRDNYSRLGVLRTKPGRADSSPALSMSCSDKIAKWSVLGILGGFASRFLEPVYVKSVVIGEFPLEVENTLRDIVSGDCERALRTRVGNTERLPEGYAVHPPDIRFTDIPFVHSKSELDKIKQTKGSCNESLCWVADSRPLEVLINGLKRSTPPKYRYTEKYRQGLFFEPLLSRISSFNLYNDTLDLVGLTSVSCSPCSRESISYAVAKKTSGRYQNAKSCLLGPGGPFSGWIRIDTQYQRFSVDGNHCTSLPILSASI